MGLVSIAEINQYLAKVPNWSLEDNGKSIMKLFEFTDFRGAINFINKIAEIAEQEKHHPDMRVYDYNRVEVKLTTHSVQGLTEKDFKVAGEIDGLNFNN